MLNVYTWDIETRWGSGEIIKIAVFDGITTHYFNTVEEFWQYLTELNEKGNKIYMYAHHHGYDVSGILMDEFAGKNIEVDLMKSMFTRNKIALKLYFKGLNKIEFRDSLRLFPMSLEKVTKGFKTKHQKMNIEEEIKKRGLKKKFKNEEDFFNKVDKNNPLLLDYLKHDVRGLYEAIQLFTQITGVGVRKMITAAAVAMSVFKEQFPNSFKSLLTNKFGKVKYLKKSLKDFSRKTYKGGRVEVVKRKGEKVYMYDVNSLYPYVMAKFDYPTGDYKQYKGGVAHAKFNMLYWSESPQLGLIRATVYIPKTKVTPLPVRVNKKQYYPYGELEGYWTTTELIHAIKKHNVEVLKVHEMWLWQEKCKPFTDYINKFFKLKDKEKGAVRFVAKLLMNSLYGKFGMREEGIRVVYVEDYEKNKELQKLEILYEREIGGKRAYVLKDKIYADYILPHIAAYITSYSRLVLLWKIEELLERGYEVYYYDTDSVHTNCPREEFYNIDDKELGFWKYEGYEPVMYYATPKLYAGKNNKNKVKAKGIPKKYHPDFELFKEMIENDEVIKHIFTGTRIRTLWEILTDSDKKEREEVISKVVSLLNAKRKPINNYDTEPWHIDEISNLQIRKKIKRGRDGKVNEIMMSVNGIEVKTYSDFVKLLEKFSIRDEIRSNQYTA